MSYDELLFQQSIKIDVLDRVADMACHEIVRLSQRVADLEEELAWMLNTAREA